MDLGTSSSEARDADHHLLASRVASVFSDAADARTRSDADELRRCLNPERLMAPRNYYSKVETLSRVTGAFVKRKGFGNAFERSNTNIVEEAISYVAKPICAMEQANLDQLWALSFLRRVHATDEEVLAEGSGIAFDAEAAPVIGNSRDLARHADRRSRYLRGLGASSRRLMGGGNGTTGAAAAAVGADAAAGTTTTTATSTTTTATAITTGTTSNHSSAADATPPSTTGGGGGETSSSSTSSSTASAAAGGGSTRSMRNVRAQTAQLERRIADRLSSRFDPVSIDDDIEAGYFFRRHWWGSKRWRKLIELMGQQQVCVCVCVRARVCVCACGCVAQSEVRAGCQWHR